MRQKFLKVRGYVTVLLAVLLALCLGLGAIFALPFTAYAEEETDADESISAPVEDENTDLNDEDGDADASVSPPAEEERTEEGDVDGDEVGLFMNGWSYGSYDTLRNSINLQISNVDYAVQYTVYYDKNGEIGTPVINLNNFSADEYGIVSGPEAIKKFTELGVGTYWLEAKRQGTTIVLAHTTFTVTNGWKSEPKVIEWAYGSYDADINKISAEALDGNTVSFSVLTDELVAIDGLENFTEVSGAVALKLAELNAGIYYIQCDATELTETVEFSVRQLRNRWEVVPSFTGWSEGQFKSTENKFIGKPEQGEAKFTIKDAKGTVLFTYEGGKLRTADGESVSADKYLNELAVGTYTLIAEVDGTGNYSGLYAELQFSVFENPVALSVIIAVTVTFAVIDLIAAGICVSLIIIRRRKVERQFRNMVSTELHRR